MRTNVVPKRVLFSLRVLVPERFEHLWRLAGNCSIFIEDSGGVPQTAEFDLMLYTR